MDSPLQNNLICGVMKRSFLPESTSLMWLVAGSFLHCVSVLLIFNYIHYKSYF